MVADVAEDRSTMPVHRISRGASAGLAVTLLALTALSLAGVVRTRRSAEVVAHSSAVAVAYTRANEAVAAEESLERKYRLEPGPAVRAMHAKAGADLRAALAEVRRDGDAADRVVVDQVLVMHTGYDQAMVRMFT
ncbi:MAG: hypothetical protein V7603_548, partial [Micromonosporaceae bacterium]